MRCKCKDVWAVPLEDKISITITNAFQKRLDESNFKSNKMGRYGEFYNKSMKSWLPDDNIEMYSTREGKSVVTETFITTLKNKIYNKWIQYQKMCMLRN